MVVPSQVQAPWTWLRPPSTWLPWPCMDLSGSRFGLPGPGQGLPGPSSGLTGPGSVHWGVDGWMDRCMEFLSILHDFIHYWDRCTMAPKHHLSSILPYL